MSSEYGKRMSMEQLKAQFKANAAAATEASAALVLTEMNWGALNSSVKLLGDLTTDLVSRCSLLMTEEDLNALLAEQAEAMQQNLAETEAEIESLLARFQKILNDQNALLKKMTEDSIRQIQSQAGKESENFTSECSQAAKDLKRWQTKFIWISVGTSIVVVLLSTLSIIL